VAIIIVTVDLLVVTQHVTNLVSSW